MGLSHKKNSKYNTKIKYILQIIGKTVAMLLIFLIRGLRPLLGPSHCKYAISCTNYAAQKLSKEPLFKAVWQITKRVLSCNPFMDPR